MRQLSVDKIHMLAISSIHHRIFTAQRKQFNETNTVIGSHAQNSKKKFIFFWENTLSEILTIPKRVCKSKITVTHKIPV